MFHRKEKNISEEEEEEEMITKIQISHDVIKLVVLRVSCVIVLLTSAVFITLSVLFKPWKLEFNKNAAVTFEISVWEVCRNTPKGAKCYEGELDRAPAWFLVFRWFLMLPVIFQYIATFYVLIMLLVRKNKETRAFWVPSLISLVSASLVITSMVILVAYWEFEFLDESRKFRMGWREAMDLDEVSGWTRDMGYISVSFMLASSCLCLCTHFKDNSFAKDCNVNQMENYMDDR